MNDQYFHAHNAALIAVLVLGDNGHLGFSCTFNQIHLTVRVVVILKAIKRMIVSVAVDCTHSWAR